MGINNSLKSLHVTGIRIKLGPDEPGWFLGRKWSKIRFSFQVETARTSEETREKKFPPSRALLNLALIILPAILSEHLLLRLQYIWVTKRIFTYLAPHFLDARWNMNTFPSKSMSTAVTWPSLFVSWPAGLFLCHCWSSSSNKGEISLMQCGSQSPTRKSLIKLTI